MRFTVEGVKHEFDETKITFGEARALEKVTGYSIGEVSKHADGDAMEMAVVQAFVWVAMKREQPTLTFADLDDMSLADIHFYDEDDTEDVSPADPTAGAEPSTPDA